uniref:Uncharacterized protein MANES_17G079900 n=1 Tax=Rhizophora mucronata TaxID=61149 RepID=A0A2P2KJ74_RHIMU
MIKRNCINQFPTVMASCSPIGRAWCHVLALKLCELLQYRVKVSDREHGEHGWTHLRQSIHNPNIAVNMQSTVMGGCQSMAKVLRDKYAHYQSASNNAYAKLVVNVTLTCVCCQVSSGQRRGQNSRCHPDRQVCQTWTCIT